MKIVSSTVTVALGLVTRVVDLPLEMEGPFEVGTTTESDGTAFEWMEFVELIEVLESLAEGRIPFIVVPVVGREPVVSSLDVVLGEES